MTEVSATPTASPTPSPTAAQTTAPAAAPSPASATAGEQDRSLFPPPRQLPPPPHSGGAEQPSPEEIRYLVAHALAAPSGGNFQAWRFRYRDGKLLCSFDPGRGDYFANYRHNELLVSLGAAVTNIELVAPELGFTPQLELFPDADDPLLACVMSFTPQEPSPRSELAAQIPYRVSCRKVYEAAPLAAAEESLLREMAAAQGAELHLLSSPQELTELGEILGRMNVIAYLNRDSHAGIMKILRWNNKEAAASRDGILVDTFELSPLELSGLRFMSNYSVMKFVSHMGADQAIEAAVHAWARSSAAMALLTVAQPAAPGLFTGGRALEHLWLAATGRGLAFHILGLLSFFDRLDGGAGEGFNEAEVAELQELRQRFLQLFPAARGQCEVSLLRILEPNPKVERTLRRQVDDVLRCD